MFSRIISVKRASSATEMFLKLIDRHVAYCLEMFIIEKTLMNRQECY